MTSQVLDPRFFDDANLCAVCIRSGLRGSTVSFWGGLLDASHRANQQEQRPHRETDLSFYLGKNQGLPDLGKNLGKNQGFLLPSKNLG